MNRSAILALLTVSALLFVPTTATARYVDGMNLYRGYFIPDETDPSGLYTCKCTCLDASGPVMGSSQNTTSTWVDYLTLNAPNRAAAQRLCTSKCSSNNAAAGNEIGFFSRTCKGTLVDQEEEINNLDKCSTSLFMAWYRHELTYLNQSKWTAGLPACPCNVRCGECEYRVIGNKVKRVPKLPCYPDSFKAGGNPWLDYYHPGGVYEIRAEDVFGHGQQCVYDTNGDLLTNSPGAGSADFRSPIDHFWDGQHNYYDVRPWDCAKKLDAANGGSTYLDFYHDVRPINGGKPCKNY